MTKLITTTEALARFCESLEAAAFVTVDTEFMRERTYYAKLCLVQLGGPDQAAAIDPLAEGIDLAPLFALMNKPKVLKVFHAARQDIEIFVNLTGRIPAPLFDTQIAAMVCGFGESASYESLVNALAGQHIDKSSRFTDWSRRPLTDRQIDYALADVTHLRVIYEKLTNKLEKTGRANWVREEMESLHDLSLYEPDPYELWQRIKFKTDKPQRLAILRELTAWREMEARRTNQPRGRVLKDEALLEIASHAPKTTDELARTRGLNASYAQGRCGTEILAAIEKALAMPSDEWPKIEKKRPPVNGTSAILELLKVLLKHVCEKHDVAPKLIASAEDLDALAAQDAPDIKTLKGWRYELFGQTALELKEGKLALAIRKRKVTLLDV